ncbi:hypothetical protein MJK71_16090 [Escherichia coli]|nr:hypothetical protein MJK71_16090 [Escherichia coli]
MKNYSGFATALIRHHQPAARELAAAIVWRLYCLLSQLEQAPVTGTIGTLASYLT